MKYIVRISAFIVAIAFLQLAACKKENESFAIADFSYSGDTTSAPANIKFENTGFGADAFFWQFDTLGVSEEENPSFEFLRIGVYRITLRATGPSNVDSISKSITIGAQAEPTAQFSVEAPLLASTPIRFSNTSLNANAFVWEFGDGSTSTAIDPEHTYAEVGTYQVALTATNNLNGESNTYSQTLEVSIAPTVASLDCQNAVHSSSLSPGTSIENATSTVPYEGGNGATYSAVSVNSSGVTGLTAQLEAGTLENGSGTLTWNISGMAQSTGTASFIIDFGGQTCVLNREIISYPAGYVHCGTPTEVVEVVSLTGKTWMDRNLGANRVATSSTDASSYGDLYQWGRGADGHQCRNSGTTSSLSSSDQPGHDDFIITVNAPFDWRSPQNNDLWQGVDGINNPCPAGFRLPTIAEWYEEALSWSSPDPNGAFDSPLKLPLAGQKSSDDGLEYEAGNFGVYWSSDTDSTQAFYLILSNNSGTGPWQRAAGFSVRCIKD